MSGHGAFSGIGGRGGGGSSKKEWYDDLKVGGKSAWDDSAKIVDMDEFLHVMRNLNDNEYYDETIYAVKQTWDLLQDAIHEGRRQVNGIEDKSFISINNGMAIDLNDVYSYSHVMSLNTVTYTGLIGVNGDRDKKINSGKYSTIIADYLQNKVMKGRYNAYKVQSDVIDASPSAVQSLARKSEKTIMSKPDSLTKYLALERRAARDERTGKYTMSDAAYQKQAELFEVYRGNKHNYMGNYESEYKKRYGKSM